MSDQWSYFFPEDSGAYFWQPQEDQKPILVYWDSRSTMATGLLNGYQYYYPLSGRWFQPTHPDPLSSWDRPQPPQLEITNSTKEPFEVRVSELKSDYVDRHPEMIEGLEEDDNQSREDHDVQ